MNEVVKRAMRIISSVLIVGCLVSIAGFIVNRPLFGLDQTVRPFYSEEKDSLDYVVIGSSATWLGISPLEVYASSGLRGYNLSMNAITANVYESMLREVIDRQKKATIIVDIDGFLAGDSAYEEKAPISYWIDSMDRNENWFRTIQELDWEKRIEHYFPIIRYHGSLLSMGVLKNAFSPAVNTLYTDLKGFYNYPDAYCRFLDGNSEDATVFLFNTDEKEAISPTASGLLDNFLNVCSELDVENIVFVRMPRAYIRAKDYDSFVMEAKQCNFIRERVEKYGYTVIDYSMFDNPAGLSPNDFVDTGHLHIDGALKFSTFLATYLFENSNEVDWNNTSEWGTLANSVDEKYNAIRCLPASNFE